MTPLRRHASSSGSDDLLALEVLGQDVVVRLGGRLEQLVPAAGHLGLQLGRDRDLDLGRAVPGPGLAVDEVDVALERLGGADRQLERRDLVAEGRPERVEGRRRVAVLALALVDEEAGGGVRLAARSRRRARARPRRRSDASITKMAPSAAAKPSTTSAKKSG